MGFYAEYARWAKLVDQRLTAPGQEGRRTAFGIEFGGVGRELLELADLATIVSKGNWMAKLKALGGWLSAGGDDPARSVRERLRQVGQRFRDVAEPPGG